MELVSGIVPLGAIIFAALGSIIFGLATPTEAAAMGAFGAAVLTAGYGRLTYAVMRDAADKTIETTWAPPEGTARAASGLNESGWGHAPVFTRNVT